MLFDYEYFKREILKLTGVDLNSYKENQMKRRIDGLMQRRKIAGYEQYVLGLSRDRGLYEEFLNYITINVSEFYRDPVQWKVMEEQMIPELISRFGRRLRIWSAACSTGDEPYSLVMALSRHLSLAEIRIYATDMDKQVLAKAREGIYPERSIVSLPADLKRRYFTKQGEDYKIANEIKACVEFREHNLLKDEYLKDCHLILCRNVLIYFTEEAKDIAYRKFFKSLCRGGLFLSGSSEQIMNFREIGFARKNVVYYQKP